MKSPTLPTTPIMKNGSAPISTNETLADDPNYVIKDITEFHMKSATVHLTGQEYLIVDERVYKAVGRGVKTNYLTYGDPGIKVYLEGTKEACDIEDAKTVY